MAMTEAEALRDKVYLTYVRQNLNEYTNNDFDTLMAKWREETSGVDEDGKTLNKKISFQQYIKENGRERKDNPEESPGIYTFDQFISAIYVDPERVAEYVEDGDMEKVRADAETFFHEYTLSCTSTAVFQLIKVKAMTIDKAMIIFKNAVKSGTAGVGINDIQKLNNLHANVTYKVEATEEHPDATETKSYDIFDGKAYYEAEKKMNDAEDSSFHITVS